MDLGTSRRTLAADSTLTAAGMGAATETAHTAISLLSDFTNTVRRLVKFKAILLVDAHVDGNWTIRARLGGVGGVLLGATAATVKAAGDVIVVEGFYQIWAIGAAATAEMLGKIQIGGSGNWAESDTFYSDNATIDTTIDQDLVITSESSTNTAGNDVTLVHFEYEVYPAN